MRIKAFENQGLDFLKLRGEIKKAAPIRFLPQIFPILKIDDEMLDVNDSDDEKPAAELLPLVYDELRTLAAVRLANERPGHTLQATALVHEVWLKLAGEAGHERKWKNRQHYYAAAAEAMRRILIDHARAKMTGRRGGDWIRISFDGCEIPCEATPTEIIDLSDAVERLESRDRRRGEVAKLRIFTGMTVSETAVTLGISEATVARRWNYAKAWLTRELQRENFP